MGLLNRILTGESKAEETARLARYRQRADEYKGQAREARQKLREARRQQAEDRESRWPDPQACREYVRQCENALSTAEHNERVFRSWAEGK